MDVGVALAVNGLIQGHEVLGNQEKIKYHRCVYQVSWRCVGHSNNYIGFIKINLFIRLPSSLVTQVSL